MIILILIILLCFNIYIKNIHSCFYTLILLFLFICHELYFYNSKENFNDNENEYAKFKKTPTIKKQQCIFEKQIKLLDPNQPINSICYKIKDRQTCSKTKECLYDNELNTCVDNDLCNNIKDTEIKCHFMDDEINCQNLRTGNTTDTCNFNITECNNNSNCETHYSTDVYNKSNNTNIVDCYNFNKFKTIIKQFYGSFPEPNILESENDIDNTIYDNTMQKNITYYGIRKLDNKIYLYLFEKLYNEVENMPTVPNSNDNFNNVLDTKIKESTTLSYNCLNNDNKYLGTFNSIIIYKINKQCINKPKCKWDKSDNMCYKNSREETIEQLKYDITATTATTATTAPN